MYILSELGLKRKQFFRVVFPYYAKAHVFVSFPHKKSSFPFLYRPPPLPRRPPQHISVVRPQRDSHISRRLLISLQDMLSWEEEKSSPSITISRRCKDGAIELFYCHPLMSRRSRCSIFCVPCVLPLHVLMAVIKILFMFSENILSNSF